MSVLLDTNFLISLGDPKRADHAAAVAAYRTLRLGRERLVVVPQVVYEYWVVATKPVANNGLGFDAPRADAEVDFLLTQYPLLPDDALIFREWRRLVVAFAVNGKPAHDARLVAAMNVHGIDSLLTFNVKHFARYRGIIDVLDPAVVAASGNP